MALRVEHELSWSHVFTDPRTRSSFVLFKAEGAGTHLMRLDVPQSAALFYKLVYTATWWLVYCIAPMLSQPKRRSRRCPQSSVFLTPKHDQCRVWVWINSTKKNTWSHFHLFHQVCVYECFQAAAEVLSYDDRRKRSFSRCRGRTIPFRSKTKCQKRSLEESGTHWVVRLVSDNQGLFLVAAAGCWRREVTWILKQGSIG